MGEGARSLQSDTGSRARHNRGRGAEVETVEDLIGGGAGVVTLSVMEIQDSSFEIIRVQVVPA